MPNQFFEDHKTMITNTGIVGGVAALFLNVREPAEEATRLALGNIQIFSLLLLLICVGTISYWFVIAVYRYGRSINLKHDIGKFYVSFLPFTVGVVLVWVLLNLSEYIASRSPESLGQLLGVMSPLAVTIFGISILVLISALLYRFKIFPRKDRKNEFE